MALEFVKLIKGDDVISQVGSFGFFKLGVESGGGDVPSSTFSTMSWSEIANISDQISKNSMTSAQVYDTYGWKLGDVKNITLSTGETIQVAIIGYCHETLSGTNFKAGLTVQMVNCLAERSQMNTSTTASWYGGSLFFTLAQNVKKTLPQDLQNVIKTAVKTVSYGNASTGSTTLGCDMFPLSEKELLGTTSYAYLGGNEGTQYEYWKEHNNAEDRIKYYDADGDGVPETATNYWLRSAGTNKTTQTFVAIKTDGTGRTASATQTYGVNFAFCI